ncbi:MBL fold metallo-hydrolase [Hoyosella subflava]|uniref:Beta-lactamase domain protein n=1 Tax=Hoyosella subflava (strain DSM 45089 / JCM 17490 / NBRC 109087 / DQS3-9A1) TaxID=443218 RepID=F6EF44_HOYSD|nr:MBL fold metallo-hydrolase [Hoyosella subflava]AEF38623.1 Beta-lactamase domain protein [Hoyosella subflava DQS3-9A1]
MIIGDTKIEALIDGEALMPKEYLYIGENAPTEEDWSPYTEYLDTCTGHQLNSIGSFLIRTGERLILNDAGSGPNVKAPFSGGGLRSALWAAGVKPTDITDVIYSHLHLDHVGWTTLDDKPFFPNADLWIDRRDWHHFAADDYEMQEWEAAAVDPVRDKIAAKFAPVHDRVNLFEPDTEILPGVRAMDAAGHTPGNTVFELVSRGERGLLIGDLVHTQGELVNGWDLAFNGDHAQSIETIEKFRKYILDNNIPFAAAHFPGLRWGRLWIERGTSPAIAYATI